MQQRGMHKQSRDFALDMGQRSNDAVLMDVLIMSSREEFALDMGKAQAKQSEG